MTELMTPRKHNYGSIASVEHGGSERFSSSVNNYLNTQWLAQLMLSGFDYKRLYIFAPSVFILSLLIGICFYMVVNGWDFPTSYYFAIQVLIGEMFGVPAEQSKTSQMFTFLYFLWGTALLTGAIGTYATFLVANFAKFAADERRKARLGAEAPFDHDGDGIVGISDTIKHYRYKLMWWLKWQDHSSKYLAIGASGCWVGVGMCYGMLYEQWSLSDSFFFSFSGMAGSGLRPPSCNSANLYACHIGTFRALSVGTYLLIGVPLFTFTMGQFAGLIVEKAVRHNELKVLSRPLSESEFRFALSLQKTKKPIARLSPIPEEGSSLLDYSMEDYSLTEVETENNQLADRLNSGTIVPNSRVTSNTIKFSSIDNNKPVAQTNHNDSNDDLFDMDNNFLDNTTYYKNPSHVRPQLSASSFPSQSSTISLSSAAANNVQECNHNTIDLGEFIVLELMRLKRIDREDLREIKLLFELIDDDGSGVIDREKLANHQLLMQSDLYASQQAQVAGAGSDVAAVGLSLNTSGDNNINYHSDIQDVEGGGSFTPPPPSNLTFSDQFNQAVLTGRRLSQSQ